MIWYNFIDNNISDNPAMRVRASRVMSKPVGRSTVVDCTLQKRCPKCGQTFPATPAYFHRAKDRPDGLYTYCKSCACEDARKWGKDHPEKVREHARLYRKEHLEQVRENSRRWSRKNSERAKQHYANNLELYRRRRKAQYEREKDAAKQKAREWYINNKERAFRSAKIGLHRRLARKQNLPDTFTDENWQFALRYFGHCCAVCGRPRGLWHTIAMDHWIPLSDPRCPGTVAKNIVPLCHGLGGCNNSKNDSDPHEWLVNRFGKRRAAIIEKRIRDFFSEVSK